MGWVLFSFHLQRSYSLVVFNQCATLYLVRISSPAPCGRNRGTISPGRVGGKARKKLCASVTSLSRAVFNERATNESRLLYKKEQHGYNSHRIVCIRSRDCAATHPLGQKRCGKGHTRLMKRYGDGQKSVPFLLYQVF